MAGPNLNDLRTLAISLPPSERVQVGEVADVVSALVAAVTHGKGLVDAAHNDGIHGVQEFYHAQAVEQAQQNDAPEPVRGTPHAPAAPVTAAAPSQSGQIDYEQLAAAIVRKQNAERDAAEGQRAQGTQDSSAGDASQAEQSPADDPTQEFFS